MISSSEDYALSQDQIQFFEKNGCIFYQSYSSFLFILQIRLNLSVSYLNYCASTLHILSFTSIDIQLKSFFSQEEVQKLQQAFTEVVEQKRSRFLNQEEHWHDHEDKSTYDKISNKQYSF